MYVLITNYYIFALLCLSIFFLIKAFSLNLLHFLINMQNKKKSHRSYHTRNLHIEQFLNKGESTFSHESKIFRYCHTLFLYYIQIFNYEANIVSLPNQCNK